MQHINNKSTFSNEYETGFSLVKIEEKTLLRDYPLKIILSDDCLIKIQIYLQSRNGDIAHP